MRVSVYHVRRRQRALGLAHGPNRVDKFQRPGPEQAQGRLQAASAGFLESRAILPLRRNLLALCVNGWYADTERSASAVGEMRPIAFRLDVMVNCTDRLTPLGEAGNRMC